MNSLIEKIKNMDKDEIISLSHEIREIILNSSSLRRNTHFSSNLGNVESICCLFKIFDFNKDKIFFDVGHQCYAYKYITGRNINNIKDKNDISGFTDRFESKFDFNCAGHASTSIGYAIGSSYNSSGENIAYIGDGSFSSCLSLGSLNYITNKIIIILNDNNMSISKTIGSLTKENNSIKKICDLYNIKYLEVLDGNNVESVLEAYKVAKTNKTAVLIHLHTIKGLGFEDAENDKVGIYHKLCNPNSDKSCSSKVKAIIEDVVKKRSDSLIVCPATGIFLNSNVDNNKIINVGINEELATVIASGMASSQLHPILSLNSSFTNRAADQIIYELALNEWSSLVLIDKTGLIGFDGKTHQGLYDETLLINTPNCVITMPSNAIQIKDIVNESYSFDGPTVIRFNDEIIPEEGVKSINRKWICYSNKSKNAVVTFGPTVNDVLKLCRLNNFDLIEALYLSEIDNNIDILLGYEKIIIYNPYSTDKGFANALIGCLIEKGFKGVIKKKCVPLKFIEHASKENQITECGLNIESIFDELK